jgi:flotillin
MNILGTSTSQPAEGIPTAAILALMMLTILVVLMITFIRRFRRCPANKVLVISGKTGREPAKCVHGGAAFVLPLFQSYDYLDLSPFVLPIDVRALSQENARVAVALTVTAAISHEPGTVEKAAARLLGLTPAQVQAASQEIVVAQLRDAVAAMRVEDIDRGRRLFAQRVNEAVSAGLEKIGVALININIRDISDETGAIKTVEPKTELAGHTKGEANT